MALPANFEDYINCCRCCFDEFNNQSVKIVVNSQQQRSFEILTEVELRMEPIYSKFMCTTCVSDLRKFMEFRGLAAMRQKKLYESTPKSVRTELTIAPTISFKQEVVEATAINVTTTAEDSQDPEPEFKLRECYVKIDKLDESLPAIEHIKLEVMDYFDAGYSNETENTSVNDIDQVPWLVKKVAAVDQRKPRNEKTPPKKSKKAKELKSKEEKPVKLKKVRKTATKKPKKTKPYKDCDLCGYRTDVKRRIVEHMIINHTINAHLYKCHLCKFTSKVERRYKYHTSRRHNSDPGKALKCDLCSKIFLTREGAEKHRLDHFKTIKCEICNVVFNTKTTLYLHNAKYHSTNTAELACKLCDEKFQTKNQLYDHRRKHRRYYCQVEGCGRSFSTKAMLAIHDSKDHLNNLDKATLICDFCNFETFYKANLINHMRIKHVGDQQILKCPQCSYTTVLREYLTNHMNQHNENPEFACLICHKRFHMKQQRNQHMRVVHQSKNLKLSPCWLCGETFKKENLLDCHIKTYHPAEMTLFHCNQCFESFHVEDCYVRHMRVSHPTMTKCTMRGCNLEFPQRKLMLQHLEKNHRTEFLQNGIMCHICGDMYPNQTRIVEHLLTMHPN